MRRAGVIALVLAGTLAFAAPAFAAGRRAYSAGSPSQIFVGGAQITRDPDGAANPDWSRDGRLIAYDVGGARLAVANADGSGEHFITIEMSAVDPSWSPDSSQLAFTGVQYDQNGNPEDTSLYITQADGSNYGRIGDGSQPDWSPTGDWIVYRSNPADTDGLASIWRIRPDGSDNGPVASGGSDPSFSPDGKRVAFVSSDGNTIYTTSLRGGKKHRVVRDPSAKTSPVFSPDGRAIVYATSAGLWKVRAKGGRPKRISAVGGSVAWQPR